MAPDFRTWFRATREKKRLTQTQTAEQLRLTSPTISRWETGTEPRASHLLRICRWAPIKAEKLMELLE
jgi:transcriptional regulator with XRE-family HTH domain